MENKLAALVTGGSRGIGRAVSIRLAKDGYHIVINYKNNVKEAKVTQSAIIESGGSCELFPFDVTNRNQAKEAIEEIADKYTLHVLVLCAGIRHDELLVFMTDDQWDSVIDTNLSSFFAVVKPIARHMMLNRKGRIIVISSTSGESGLPGQVNYSAAKAGLIGATKALAQECAKRNVLVNAITPGFIATDMTDSINENKMSKNVPLKRFGKPQEVAGAVSFFASRDAGYITGQVLGVNGGVYM